jgi:alkanesulfonate monooxygenase SsuD/methylene tetrahydromethanopterin reductase-like flavin-dependent oxidoreductase (luciferase family)
VQIGPQNCRMQDLRDLWRWLDDEGVDLISVWDHLYEAPYQGGTVPTFEAVASLATLAADTTRSRLAGFVFCPTFRHPALLAKAAITLDHVSNGRFELGLGGAWFHEEAVALGLPSIGSPDDAGLLTEQLEVITGLMRGERVTHHGQFIETGDAACVPRPQGRMPIWVGGLPGPSTLRAAARYADGWIVPYASIEDFRKFNSELSGHLELAGREPSSVSRAINLVFALNSSGPDAVSTREATPPGASGRTLATLSGRPEDAPEQLSEYLVAGADLISVSIRPPWDRDALATYVCDVMPKMRVAFSR